MKSSRSHLTALSLVCFLWNVKEITPLFENSRSVEPGGVANLSWAGWVICKNRLKLEPCSVLCSTPYGGSD